MSLPKQFQGFIFLPRDIVKYDCTEENKEQYYSDLFTGVDKVLLPCLEAAYKKSPAMRKPFTLDATFVLAWQLGWQSGAIELTVTKNAKGDIDSFAILTRKKLLTCEELILEVEWLWGETQEKEDALLARIKEFAGLLPGIERILVTKAISETEIVGVLHDIVPHVWTPEELNSD